MKLKYLVIHCTATPEGRVVTPGDIKKWHLSPPPQGRGWKQVGYSDMITINGELINLVPYNEDSNVDRWEITNGATGINAFSRHVVYVGGCDRDMKPKDTRTPEQLRTLSEYVWSTIEKHPDILVAGHNQFAKKACPSFSVPDWLDDIGVLDHNIYRIPPL
jgi:N-acetylmuramoyl-L-alanine amidase